MGHSGKTRFSRVPNPVCNSSSHCGSNAQRLIKVNQTQYAAHRLSHFFEKAVALDLVAALTGLHGSDPA